MYTVYFKIWNNNWSQNDEPEYYNTLAEAKKRAMECNTVETEAMGDNNFNTNGVECWVEWMENGVAKRWKP